MEVQHLSLLGHLTRLTALHLAQLRVLNAAPMLAGLVLARALEPLTSLQVCIASCEQMFTRCCCWWLWCWWAGSSAPHCASCACRHSQQSCPGLAT